MELPQRAMAWMVEFPTRDTLYRAEYKECPQFQTPKYRNLDTYQY